MQKNNASTDPGILKVPEGYQKVRFLRPHPKFGYSDGAIGILTRENVIRLINEDMESPFIELLPDDFVEPVIEKKAIPEDQLIEVRWIKSHSGFAYSEGDIGRVPKDSFIMLAEGGYVELTKKSAPLNQGWLKNMLLR